MATRLGLTTPDWKFKDFVVLCIGQAGFVCFAIAAYLITGQFFPEYKSHVLSVLSGYPHSIFTLIAIYYVGFYRYRVPFKNIFRKFSFLQLLFYLVLSIIFLYLTTKDLLYFGYIIWESFPQMGFDVDRFVIRPLLEEMTSYTTTPIVEELVFRGVILAYVFRKTSRMWLAILVSSLLFGLVHYKGDETYQLTLFNSVVSSFLHGVLIGIAYIRTKSLYVPIILHAVWNLTLVLLPAIVYITFWVQTNLM